MYRPFAISIALVLALLGGVPAAARAQDGGGQEQSKAPAVREHPDLSLARTLGYGYAWYDLAFDVLDALEKARPGAKVLEDAASLRAELKAAYAGTVKDPAKREELMKEARGAFEERAKKGSVEAQLRLGEMLLHEGDAAFARMRTAEDGDTRASARKEAEEKYQSAEKYFDELIPKLADILEKLDEGKDQAKADEAFVKHMIARFNHVLSMYQYTQLLEKGAKERDDRLKRVVELLGEFQFEYANQVLGYEAAIRLGLAAKDLGDMKQAYAAFDSALGIKDFFVDESGNYRFDDAARDIISRASYFKAQTLNEIGEHDGALKAVKELFELIPDMQRDRLGFAARIEEGIAWGRKGDLKKAQAILEKVAEDDKNGPWAATAKEKLGVLAGGGGGAVAMDPAKTISQAQTTIDRGKAPEGLNLFRNLIASLESAGSEEDQAKWLPVAWMKLGSAYSDEKRYDEAVGCFTTLVARFPKTDQAPEALFQKAMALLQLTGAKANDFDKSEYDATLKKLQADYPQHPASGAASFFRGIDLFSQRKYAEAAGEFEKTTEKVGKIYDAAVYQTALSHLMEAYRLSEEKKTAEAKAAFGQARIAFEKAIRWATEAVEKGKVPAEGDRADTLKRMGFDARCRLAELALHPNALDVKRALEAAENAERSLGENPDKERLATARVSKVRAHLKGDDLAGAETVVASMGNDCPESPRTAQAEREVAIAFDREAEAAKKAKKDADAKGLFAKAADHYVRWNDIAEKAGLGVPAKDLARAGNRLYYIALVLNGLPENTESFTEVADISKLEAGQRFVEAGVLFKAALEAGSTEPNLRILHGECLAFAGKYADAARAFIEACNAEKLLKLEKQQDDQGKTIDAVVVDVKVAQNRPQLLTAYADYGRCCYELMAKDRKLVDETINVATAVLGAVPAGHSLWWRGKFLLLAGYYEKGAYDEANIGLKQLERQNPNFDGGAYKPKFLELKKRLEGKKSPAKKTK